MSKQSEVTTASAKKIDAVLNAGQQKKMLENIAGIAPHIVKLLPVYVGADEKERAELLAHSPVFAEFVRLLDGITVTIVKQ